MRSPQKGCPISEDQEGQELDQVQGQVPEVPVHPLRGRQRQGGEAQAVTPTRLVQRLWKISVQLCGRVGGSEQNRGVELKRGLLCDGVLTRRTLPPPASSPQ